MSKLQATLLGSSLGIATAVGIHSPLADIGVPLLSLLLALTSCVYVGALLAQQQRAGVAIAEVLICVGVFFCALLGCLSSAYWLAAGYAIHGVWDWAHEREVVSTKVVSWFPPFCASYDFLVAAFILVSVA